MKYTHILIGTFMSIITCMFTSCYENNSPLIDLSEYLEDYHAVKKDTVLDTLTTQQKYAYTIITNSVTSDIYVKDITNGKDNAKDKGVLRTTAKSFKSEAKKGTILKITVVGTSASYSQEEVVKNVMINTNGMLIYVELPKIATVKSKKAIKDLLASAAKKQTYATVSNGSSNAKLIYPTDSNTTSVTANIKFPYQTLEAMNLIAPDDTASIILEKSTAKNINIDFSKEQEEIWVDLLKIKTAPHIKTDSATISINDKNLLKGMVVKLSYVNGKNTKEEEYTIKEDGVFSFEEKKQLNDYSLSIKVNVTKGDTIPRNEERGTFDVYWGENTLSYQVKNGYECTYNTNSIINELLNNRFGKTTYAQQTAHIKNNSCTKARQSYIIQQDSYHYIVEIGNFSTDVYAYGDYVISKIGKAIILEK